MVFEEGSELESIGFGAFEDCKDLKTIIFNGNEIELDTRIASKTEAVKKAFEEAKEGRNIVVQAEQNGEEQQRIAEAEKQRIAEEAARKEAEAEQQRIAEEAARKEAEEQRRIAKREAAFKQMQDKLIKDAISGNRMFGTVTFSQEVFRAI